MPLLMLNSGDVNSTGVGRSSLNHPPERRAEAVGDGLASVHSTSRGVFLRKMRLWRSLNVYNGG